MKRFAGNDDARAIEREMPWEERDLPRTIFARLSETAARFPDRPAISYQLLSGPTDPAETLTWRRLFEQTCQTANLFRSLGIGEKDVVAYLLPNATETVTTLLGGMVAGIANPINPLLQADQIAAILRETGAKMLVTLRAFPRTDIAQKAADAVALAPGVTTVLEVDLARYLAAPKRWIVPFVRPRTRTTHKARVLDFTRQVARQNRTLDFADSAGDRVAAYFHTGGTTGMPKVAQHTYSGMIYNGWIGEKLLFSEQDVLICPLPLFHVFAVQVILMASLASGAHVIFPTPAGYRGDGVFDNFWKLVARWKVTFIIAVPTAISALMQRKVDADISTVKTAFSGSSPLPVELYRRFETTTGIKLIEGYGLTEATCLVSINPVDGEKRIGSVGLPFPYCEVRILTGEEGDLHDCAPGEVGEICVYNPGVYVGHTYTAEVRNRDLFHDGKYLRTGDLGRLDADGYIWITGRAKDLIIRGGHNIDPAQIEEALAGHPDVAMVGAVGQPDAHSGELPCAYVELVTGATATPADLMDHARAHVPERAAIPKVVEILGELPKTAVGKVYKPDLRRRAIMRVYDEALSAAGLTARVTDVREDRTRGLVAVVSRVDKGSEDRVAEVLNGFTGAWEWAGDGS